MDATPVRWTRARDVYRFGVALGSDQSISQLGAAYSCGYGVKENQKTAGEQPPHITQHAQVPRTTCPLWLVGLIVTRMRITLSIYIMFYIYVYS